MLFASITCVVLDRNCVHECVNYYGELCVLLRDDKQGYIHEKLKIIVKYIAIINNEQLLVN